MTERHAAGTNRPRRWMRALAAAVVVAAVAIGAWLVLRGGGDSSSAVPPGCATDVDGPAALVGIDPSTGEERWHRRVGDASNATAHEAVIATMESDGRVTATDLATGDVRWCARPAEPTPDGWVLSNLVTAGDLFAAQVAGTVAALDPDSGEERWRVALSEFDLLPDQPFLAPEATTIVGGDAVFVDLRVGPGGAIALALDPETGRVLDPMPPPPTLRSSGFEIQAASNPHLPSRITSVAPLVVIDTDSGAQRWSQPLPIWHAAIVDDVVVAVDQLIAGHPDLESEETAAPLFTQRLTAFDLASGERRWQVELPGTPEKVFAFDGRVIVTNMAEILAFDAATGDPLWRVDHGSPGRGGAFSEDGAYHHMAADAQTGTIVGFVRAEEPYRD